MENYRDNRYGHRERLRRQYLATSGKGMTDMVLLEVFLCQVIPLRDVKPAVYELFNRFGTLEKIFTASPEELMKAKYIGENTACAISISRYLAKFDVSFKDYCLRFVDARIKYVKNMLANESEDSLTFIALDNSGDVISTLRLSGAEYGIEDRKQVISFIVDNNATNCIVARYSVRDINIESCLSLFSDVKSDLNMICVSFTDGALVTKNKTIMISSTRHNKMVQ